MGESGKKISPIHIVSGGKGLAGDYVVKSVLVQFPGNKIPVDVIPDVLTKKDVIKAVEKAKKTGGIIVHTMVVSEMRKELERVGKKMGVKTIDLMGELTDYISEKVQAQPISKPGLFRSVNREYFDRVEAIEYTLATDDGMRPEKLDNADIVLVGVSRTGKTPLSVYLSMFGWKVSNVPLVKDIPPPKHLFEIDSGRVFGLNIQINQLLYQRRKRMQRLRIEEQYAYLDTREVRMELLQAEQIFKKGNFTVINVTNKPVETSANEIVDIITQRYNVEDRKRKHDVDK